MEVSEINTIASEAAKGWPGFIALALFVADKLWPKLLQFRQELLTEKEKETSGDVEREKIANDTLRLIVKEFSDSIKIICSSQKETNDKLDELSDVYSKLCDALKLIESNEKLTAEKIGLLSERVNNQAKQSENGVAEIYNRLNVLQESIASNKIKTV